MSKLSTVSNSANQAPEGEPNIQFNFEILKNTQGIKALEGFYEQMVEFEQALNQDPEAIKRFSNYYAATERQDNFQTTFKPDFDVVRDMNEFYLIYQYFRTRNPEEHFGLTRARQAIERDIPVQIDLVNGKSDTGKRHPALRDIFTDESDGSTIWNSQWQSVRALRNVMYAKEFLDRIIAAQESGEGVASMQDLFPQIIPEKLESPSEKLSYNVGEEIMTAIAER